MAQINIIINEAFNKQLSRTREASLTVLRTEYDNKKYKINKKTSKEILKNNILLALRASQSDLASRTLLCKVLDAKFLINFIFLNKKNKLIQENTKYLIYKIRNNRTFDRIAKKPASKWSTL